METPSYEMAAHAGKRRLHRHQIQLMAMKPGDVVLASTLMPNLTPGTRRVTVSREARKVGLRGHFSTVHFGGELYVVRYKPEDVVSSAPLEDAEQSDLGAVLIEALKAAASERKD